MKRLLMMSLCVFSCGVVFAQPPGGREGRPPRDGEQRPREGGPGGPGAPPHFALMDALDANHDHVISAEEIEAATATLLKLDKNQDGKLTEDEFGPPRPRGEAGAPPPREGDREHGRPPRETGDRPRGDGPRDGGPRDGGPRDGGPRDGGPRDGGPRDGFGRPDARGPGGPEGPGGPRGPMGPGGPGFGGPPDPARFIDHVMEFDANDDGLMSREELMSFVEKGMRSGGPGGPGREGGPGGDGGPRGPREGRPEGNRGDQERPARPARPDAE